MRAPVRLAVLGAGLIGRRHVEQILVRPETALHAVVDPSPDAAARSAEDGVPWFPSFDAMLGAERPDGVVVATPNAMHVEHALAAVAAGLPVLVEKPIADTVLGASRLVEAAEQAGVPLLVGHHRRHNPVMRRAAAIVASGEIGRVVAVQATCWFYKPDAYFETGWRSGVGGGPIFLNLIHDIDCLRAICGDVDAVQAIEANAVRSYAVEDTAGLLLRFRSGAIGTVSVSDAVVAPFSWELTSGENAAYPRTGESCYLIGGTHGTLTVPQLDRWHYAGERGWTEPILSERASSDAADPLGLQIAQLAAVIRGEEPPLVSGRDGLETLRVIEAAKTSAASGKLVSLR